jgi:hypothetical protein
MRTANAAFADLDPDPGELNQIGSMRIWIRIRYLTNRKQIAQKIIFPVCRKKSTVSFFLFFPSIICLYLPLCWVWSRILPSPAPSLLCRGADATPGPGSSR